MIKVYIAGAISGYDLEFLNNIRKGMRAGAELIMEGFAPFVPFLDYQLFLQLREGEEITKQKIQEVSLMFLETCDVMLVLPNSDKSIGTKKEVQRAIDLNIPVFYNMEDLKAWTKTQSKPSLL